MTQESKPNYQCYTDGKSTEINLGAINEMAGHVASAKTPTAVIGGRAYLFLNAVAGALGFGDFIKQRPPCPKP